MAKAEAKVGLKFTEALGIGDRVHLEKLFEYTGLFILLVESRDLR